MSLVEKAMTRMRKSGDTSRSADTTGELPIISPSGEDMNEPVKTAKRLVIELNSLRAGGYLPEPDKDRQFADHYRQIKRPLIRKAFAAPNGPLEPRVIMVTSALPGDGKTFTSINLSLSLARERDLSVLLVDTDLPKPHVSRIFGVQHAYGLLDALVDDSVAIESLVMPTTIKGLSLLPAGTSTDGASEWLTSERMRQILKNLISANPRRIVLLDSPPLLITSEGKALTSLAGQVVLVVRAGQTPRQAVLDAVALFTEQQAGGIVLNEARGGIMQGYYGYGYGKYGSDGSDGAAPQS